MDITKIKKILQEKFPGKTIINNAGEIICEVQPFSENPKESMAIAVIDKSKPHYHQKTTEIYEVIKGKLTLYCNNKKHLLNKGEKYTIKPNIVHYAAGNETWVKCISHPGWNIHDYYLK